MAWQIYSAKPCTPRRNLQGQINKIKNIKTLGMVHKLRLTLVAFSVVEWENLINLLTSDTVKILVLLQVFISRLNNLPVTFL